MPYSIGLLHFLFFAICLLTAAAGLALLNDRFMSGGFLIAPFGVGFLLVLLGWLVFAREVLGPIRQSIEIQVRGKNSLARRASNLSGYAGNLPTKSPAVKMSEPAITIKGYWEKMARLAMGIPYVLRESIEVLYGIRNGPCRRLCYVGSDSYAEGQIAGEALGRVLAGRGSVAIIVSNLYSVNYILRRKGAIDVLAERFPNIKVIGTIESLEIGERTYSSSLDLMDRYRDLGAIYMAEGNTPSYAAKAVLAAGRAGKTFIVTHDLIDETMERIIEGSISSTVSQDPFAQGYNSVICLFNHLITGWSPSTPRFHTALREVNRENCQGYWSTANSLGSDEPGRLATIAELSARERAKLEGKRIAVIGMSSEKFWKKVHEGVLAAKCELETYGTLVNWIVPSPMHDINPTAGSNYAPIVEGLIAEKWDGIAIPVFDLNLVPLLNMAVQKGITIVTYNSEPASLREMIEAASADAEDLLLLSQELAASAEESVRPTSSIDVTINRIISHMRC